MRVSRTCTGIREMRGERREEAVSRPLEAFRSAPAYVLLGDPGAGKTTAFEMECEALGEEAYHLPVSADEFLSYDANDLPDEWRGKTMFIDGLDEVRAGSQDVAAQFREIRKILRALDAPRFRLSCRHADWRGRLDENKLKTITGDSDLIILQLDPLTLGDVEKILQARSDIPNASKFIALAQEKRMGVFLENPQALRFLAEVVGAGGKWPESRKELFEKACEKMVREHNEEHRAARDCQNALDAEQLLDAAGRLCAVQLISGAYGYTRRGEADAKYPALEQCGYDLAALRLALATKLFKGVGDNRFAPLHRHIAEFLAARYLAGVIKECLPVRRIIALITGSDGIVVTEMRGLSAWLAAHSKDARSYLIEQDPVGVGLYGDISTFLRDEKRALLYSLKGETSRLDFPGWQQAVAFRGLAVQGMEPVLRDILTDSSREKAHQNVVDLVVRVLQAGEPLPGLAGLLLEIVRDDTRWPRIRYPALGAFIHNAPDTEDTIRQLKTLLEDVRAERVADANKVLLGTLLTHLYPRHLSPPEVWDYLLEEAHVGGDTQFWLHDLVELSSDAQGAELLDELNKRLPRLRSVIASRHFHGLPWGLLSRGLKTHGDKLDTKRLYDWLDTGWVDDFGGQDRDGAVTEIRSWLEKRPDMQRAVLLEGLSRCSESDEFRLCASGVPNRLHGARLPADIGLWCLEKAVDMADSKFRVAEYLLREAFRILESQKGDAGLSREVLQEQAGKHEVLRPIAERLLQPPPLPSNAFKRRARIRQEEQQFMLDRFRSNEAALLDSRVDPGLLYEIARKYFSGFANSGGLKLARERPAIVEQEGPGGGVQAVEKWLYGDQNLTEAALQGLRGVIDREDVPDVEEVLDLESERRMHYLGLPFLAGLEEMQRTVPEDDAAAWDDARIRKAVVFYYCYGNHLHMPSGQGYCPEWYRKLIAERPEIVADVLIQYGRCVFRGGHDYASPFVDKFQNLERDSDHAQVAKHATLLLLRAFPILRAPERQSHLSSLNHLLWAAIKYADSSSFRELIDTKRSLKSIRAAQRVRWLTAAAIVWPEEYTDILNDFVQEDRDNRVRYFKAFFGSRVYGVASKEEAHMPSYAGRALFRFDVANIPFWELLIRFLGSAVGPYWGGDHASDLVRMLIEDLAGSPNEAATHALARLADDPALERWRDVLKQAEDDQRTIRRDADYSHPGVEQVCKTLDNRSPANPADLAALVMDRLNEIGRKIRGGPTSDWRQYWNVDSYNRPLRKEPEGPENSRGPSPCIEPEEVGNAHDSAPFQRPEDACRDNLLSDLQEKLRPLGIDAQPEGQYANDKRADIRVSYAGFNVPVEIKKNAHPKLWSAIHDQLIAKYTVNPGTDGYGIYLVFWFGSEYTRTPHENGSPDNAKEMEEWLKASLSPEQARKISVCVIDVSIPEGKSAGKRP